MISHLKFQQQKRLCRNVKYKIMLISHCTVILPFFKNDSHSSLTSLRFAGYHCNSEAMRNIPLEVLF